MVFESLATTLYPFSCGIAVYQINQYNGLMILIIRKKAQKEEVEKMAEDYQGYIKVVVDVERGILAGGGERHFEAEKVLLEDGSKQENLWGGGLDLETKELDYNSIINLRPGQNASRDILSEVVRAKFDNLIKDLLLG